MGFDFLDIDILLIECVFAFVCGVRFGLKVLLFLSLMDAAQFSR